MSIASNRRPASADIAAVVRRMRRSDELLLTGDMIVEAAANPAGFFNALCGLAAVGIFTLVAIGIVSAYVAGRF